MSLGYKMLLVIRTDGNKTFLYDRDRRFLQTVFCSNFSIGFCFSKSRRRVFYTSFGSLSTSLQTVTDVKPKAQVRRGTSYDLYVGELIFDNQ